MSSQAPTSVTRHRDVTPNLLQYANQSRIEGHFNDVTINVGYQRIPANRMVLSCHSVFFEKMFKCNMKEKYEHNVEIERVDGNSVENLIDYIYVGSIDINEDNVMELLEAADYLQMEEAKGFCFEFLESTIKPDNWLDILKAVATYRGDKIKDQVYHYISTHFDDITQTDDFKALSCDELKDCITNLDRNKMIETSVYQGIMIWIKHDIDARKAKLLDVLQLLLVDKLPYEFLSDILNDDLIENNFDCHKFLFKTHLKNLQTEKQGSKLISIGGANTPSTITEAYDLHGNKTSGYPDFPVNVSGHALLKMGGYIYSIGGKENKAETSEIMKNVWVCPVKDQCKNWIKVAPMNDERWLMGATVHNDNLVVAGGGDGSRRLDSTEFYEVPLNKWKTISSMKQSRSGNALVSCKGCLYTVGGWDGENYLSSVERLGDLNSKWVESPPMQIPRRWLAAVSCNNVIYAIGGQCGMERSSTTKSVEKFDPDDGKWVLVKEMNVERCAHAACVVDGKIYVVGGFIGKKFVKSVECYDPSLDTWTIVEKTENELYFHAIVSL